MEQNDFSNIGRGSLNEQFCEIILKLGHWPNRNCPSKIFSTFSSVAILFSEAEWF